MRVFGGAMRSTLAVAGVIMALGASDALATGIFSNFGGYWRGAGRISDVNGRTEALSCKSTNAPAPDGIAMSMALVCASDSYRVDFHADLYTDVQAISGTWSETTRNASGNISGAIRPGVINARTEAPGFSADILIRVVGGRRLDVSLDSHGTSINRVQVSMKR
jgi:hypothetical protein